MKNQEVDRDTIVELISDNRLQEALKALEKLTRGTHLHNQVVVLSSSYAEYSQLNRNAAQDFQTLEMQRTRISNSLLSFLDELSPDDYQKAVHIPTPVVPTPTQSTGAGVNYKWLFIGGGGVLALFILIAIFSRSNDGSTNTSEMVPEPQTEQTNSNENQIKTTPNTEESATSITLVEFGKNSQIIGVYRQIDTQNWVEKSYSNNSSFKLHEENRDALSVYLHDPSRNIDIKLDLERKAIYYSDKNKTDVEIYKIINAH